MQVLGQGRSSEHGQSKSLGVGKASKHLSMTSWMKAKGMRRPSSCAGMHGSQGRSASSRELVLPCLACDRHPHLIRHAQKGDAILDDDVEQVALLRVGHPAAEAHAGCLDRLHVQAVRSAAGAPTCRLGAASPRCGAPPDWHCRSPHCRAGGEHFVRAPFINMYRGRGPSDPIRIIHILKKAVM